MTARGTHKQLLLWLLIVNIISTFIHYTDNFVCFSQYPQPVWITSSSIYIIWTMLTAIGIIGYRLYCFEYLIFSYLCLFLYSLTGLSSFGHYFYGNLSSFSTKMHLLIWTDVLAGLAMLGFILWSELVFEKWLKSLTVLNISLSGSGLAGSKFYLCSNSIQPSTQRRYHD